MSVTIDEAIERLTLAKAESTLGGNACLVVSLTDSELDAMNVHELAVVNDDVGSVLEVRAKLPERTYASDEPLHEAITRANELIREYCEEDGIPLRHAQAIHRAMLKHELFLLDEGNLFIAWDAIGLCHDRDPTLDRMYAALSFAFHYFKAETKAPKKARSK